MKEQLIKAAKATMTAYVLMKSGQNKKAMKILAESLEENESGVDDLMDGVAQSVIELEAMDDADVDEDDGIIDNGDDTAGITEDELESSEDEDMDDEGVDEEDEPEVTDTEVDVAESVASVLNLDKLDY